MLRRIKHFCVLVAVLVLALFVSGCGADDGSSEETDDKTEGTRTYKINSETAVSDDEMEELLRVIEKRALNYSDRAVIYAANDNSDICIYIPGIDPELEEEIYAKVSSRGELSIIKNYGEENEEVVLSNGDIKFAELGIDETMGRKDYNVMIRMTKDGKDKFARVTEENVGNVLTIVYDGEVISSPKVNNVITDGVAVINGLNTVDEAKDLACIIDSGRLKYDLELVEVCR